MAENTENSSGRKEDGMSVVRGQYVFDWKNPNMTAGTAAKDRETDPLLKLSDEGENGKNSMAERIRGKNRSTGQTGAKSAANRKAGSPAAGRKNDKGRTQTEDWKSDKGGTQTDDRKNTGSGSFTANPKNDRITGGKGRPGIGRNVGGKGRLGNGSRAVRKGAGSRKRKSGMRLIRAWIIRVVSLLVFVAVLALLIWGFSKLLGILGGGKSSDVVDYENLPDYVTEQYLTVNSYSRPGIPINDEITGVVVHYTANPGTTAQQNWEYFEGLATSGETHASSNFIIGIEGEVIAAVPLGELAYASNSRNFDTISIECCHEDDTGEFSEATYESLVKLTAWLCGKYGLSSDDVIRHYDVSGKTCPKYYVDNPDAWTSFLSDVGTALKS